jgi:tetratricopeptide (TPR) repeat protein
MSKRRFLIAFSFAGEKRDFVSQVAAILVRILHGHGKALKDDYAGAISSYREALELSRSLSTESADVAIILNWLAGAERHSKDLFAAERDCIESLRISLALDYTSGVATSTSNLAELPLMLRDWPKAEMFARERLDLAKELGRLDLIAINCHRLALTCVRQGKKEEALPFVRRAVDIYTQLGMPAMIESARETAMECGD